MFYAILDGDEITFQTNGFTVSTLNTTVKVTSSGDLKVNGKKVAILDDIKTTPPLSVTYFTPTHSIPGQGNLVCKDWNKLANKLKKNGKEVAITDNSSFFGDGELQVTVPAQAPGSPPTPDPVATKSCKFFILTNQKKLTIK
ncbi:MAG: hypothetical protein N2Z85_01795 [Patescibacteria group bacterium]|nr:hypothetical protein [Patescibacteria group bacterium]